MCGGIPGNPVSADEVYRRTFDRVATKTAEYYRRYPQDVEAVAAIADRLAAEPTCSSPTATCSPCAASNPSASTSA